MDRILDNAESELVGCAVRQAGFQSATSHPDAEAFLVVIVHSPNGNFAIRRGPWKYIEGKPSPTLKRVPRRDELHAQLFNLQDDPGEKHNVINKHPDVVNRLAGMLKQQRTDGRSSTRTPQRENDK